jgi:exoribonuclease-2
VTHGAAVAELAAAAERAATAAGFALDADGAAARAATAITAVAGLPDGVRDLRALGWSSIDNATTRDLDQLEVAEPLDDGAVRLRVAIADVDALVPCDSPLDRHAFANGTSVYTGVATFPMLPERLSTDLTSLVAGGDRLCVVLELVVDADGGVARRAAYRALVRNRAQLAYESVGAWLVDAGPPPPPVAASPALAAQLRLQHATATRLRERRALNGALDLETVELEPVVRDGRVVGLAEVATNEARELISDFMIAANGATAALLTEAGLPTIRRVVRAPDRWPRIVELARAVGEALPGAPSAPSLAAFLRRRRAADPARYVELSLAVVKLLGAGDYVVHRPEEPPLGHFGLAAPDYTHSTAPNRRYADLVTQRLLKAAIAGAPSPYAADTLEAVAARCVERESAAKRVERLVAKQVAAAVLGARVGESFHAVVTGVKRTATYVRLTTPPVDGRVVEGEAGLDVGDAVRVRLVDTDVADGFIDFVRVAG